MIKRFSMAIKRLEFHIPGCDAGLNVFEFLAAIALGVAICATPFLIKWILITIHFGGM